MNIYRVIPKVSTWSVTDGVPFRTLAGLVNLEASALETDEVSDEGPETSSGAARVSLCLALQQRFIEKTLTINRDGARRTVDAVLKDPSNARTSMDDL